MNTLVLLLLILKIIVPWIMIFGGLGNACESVVHQITMRRTRKSMLDQLEAQLAVPASDAAKQMIDEIHYRNVALEMAWSIALVAGGAIWLAERHFGLWPK